MRRNIRPVSLTYFADVTPPRRFIIGAYDGIDFDRVSYLSNHQWVIDYRSMDPNTRQCGSFSRYEIEHHSSLLAFLIMQMEGTDSVTDVQSGVRFEYDVGCTITPQVYLDRVQAIIDKVLDPAITTERIIRG
jgi:hypothetical protein